MKILFYIAGFLLFCLAIKAQTVNGITNVRDSSFNLLNEIKKVTKQFPTIAIPYPSHHRSFKEDRDINYIHTGKRNLQLDVFYRKQDSKVKWPAIIIIHGGGWRSGDRTQHFLLAESLAMMRFVCVTPEYRLSTEAYYPAAVQDIKASIKWIKENAEQYNVDTNKIVVLGFSAGGQLAALVGNTNGYEKFEPQSSFTASSKVHAIIDIDGTLSFIHPESSETKPSPTIGASEYWLGYNTTENPELWKEASPLSHAGVNSVPTLFLNSSVQRMHAGRDDYMQILRQHNIYTEMHEFENSPHSFCLFEPWFTPTVTYIAGFIYKVFPNAH